MCMLCVQQWRRVERQSQWCFHSFSSQSLLQRSQLITIHLSLVLHLELKILSLWKASVNQIFRTIAKIYVENLLSYFNMIIHVVIILWLDIAQNSYFMSIYLEISQRWIFFLAVWLIDPSKPNPIVYSYVCCTLFNIYRCNSVLLTKKQIKNRYGFLS